MPHDDLDDRLRSALRDLDHRSPPPPSWEAVRTRRAPVGSRPVVAVLTVLLVLAAGSIMAVRRQSSSPVAAGNGVPAAMTLHHAPDVTLAAEGLPDPGLGMREGSVAVWTGSEYLVWGGYRGGTPAADGAAYSPSSRTWRPIPAAPIGGRRDALAVWTGTELVVWGGATNAAGNLWSTTGAAYDPATDVWRRIAEAPVASSAGNVAFNRAVWSDGHLVIGGSDVTVDGSGVMLVYDAATDRWSRFVVGALRDLTVTSTGVVGLISERPSADSARLVSLDLSTGVASTIGSLPMAGSLERAYLTSDGAQVIVLGVGSGETAPSAAIVGWFDLGTRRWTHVFAPDRADRFTILGMGFFELSSVDWVGGRLAVRSGAQPLALIDPASGSISQASQDHGPSCVAPNRATVWGGSAWFSYGGLPSCHGDVDVDGHGALLTIGG